jgi:hypothetical protein
MTYIISQSSTQQFYPGLKEKKFPLQRFIAWATEEDKERHIVWVGATITAMAAVFFPLTMSVILINGASFGLIITAMVSLSIVVVTNLAAMPTRYTIPFFLLGILIDLIVVVIALL